MIVPIVLGMMCRTTMRLPAAAHDPHGLHVLADAQRQRLTAHEPRGHEPRREADDEDQDRERRVEDHGQRDQQEEQRDREQHVDDPHHQRVDPAAEEAGDRAEQDADHRGDHRRCEPDLERHLAAVHEPAEDVEAGAVGAERVLPARGRVLGREEQRGLRVGLVGVVQERADPAEQHDEDDHADADHGEPVLDEDPERAGRPSPPLEPRFTARTAAGRRRRKARCRSGARRRKAATHSGSSGRRPHRGCRPAAIRAPSRPPRRTSSRAGAARRR